MVDISDAKDRFEDGIDFSAAQKWQNNAADRADDYEDNFEDILDEQNECAEQSRADSDGGYSRLVAYANCISSQ